MNDYKLYVLTLKYGTNKISGLREYNIQNGSCMFFLSYLSYNASTRSKFIAMEIR